MPPSSILDIPTPTGAHGLCTTNNLPHSDFHVSFLSVFLSFSYYYLRAWYISMKQKIRKTQMPISREGWWNKVWHIQLMKYSGAEIKDGHAPSLHKKRSPRFIVKWKIKGTGQCVYCIFHAKRKWWGNKNLYPYLLVYAFKKKTCLEWYIKKKKRKKDSNPSNSG